MDTVSSRPYLPDLGRWQRLLVLVGALLIAVAVLALGAAIVAATAHNLPAEQLVSPFRWPPMEGMA